MTAHQTFHPHRSVKEAAVDLIPWANLRDMLDAQADEMRAGMAVKQTKYFREKDRA